MSNTVQQMVTALLPVGRIVAGDVNEPQTKDQQGNPLTIKTGPNKGQPTVKHYFAVAIPKVPGHTHWAQTEWGAIIWQKGHADWPSLIDPKQRCITYPSFAWKIDDGDDSTPNPKANGKRNCDREGWKGCWVVHLSSSYPVKIFDVNNLEITDKRVKRGYYVEAFISIQGNGNNQNPGVYVNHSMICFRAGEPKDEIRGGPDVRSVGFGKAQLPPGVSSTPTGNVFTPPGQPGLPAQVSLPVMGAGVPNVPAGPGVPGMVPGVTLSNAGTAGVPTVGTATTFPSNPGMQGPAGFNGPVNAPAAGVPAGFPTAPTAVQPHPGFLAPPAAPAAPAAPVAPAGPVLNPALAAAGHTWAALQAAGWTLETAKAAGHVIG